MSKWLGLAAVAAAAVVGLGTGCHYGAQEFTCSAEKTCGAGGTCEPNGFCSFDDTSCPAPGRRYGDLSGGMSGKCVGEEEIDAGTKPNPDTPPDAQVCFGTAPFTICLASAPTTPLTISTTTATPVNTDTSNMCVPTTSGGGNYCVIAGTTITVEKLRATGTKPLVLIASDSITTSGLIDVGSHRGDDPEKGAGADPAACTTMAGTAPTTGGGGAGGSFVGQGGAGGASAKAGSTGGTPGTPASVTELRGGCPGQDGDGANKGIGGHGGGAVFLIAGNSINVGGGINAAGEGGRGGTQNTSGGGGGGAGGMIGLDAPTVTSNSLLLANGGGGGEGSGEMVAGVSGSDPSGINAAGGGSSTAAPNGGDGGAGSAGAAAGPGGMGNPGTTVNNKDGGGGGGGGGAGLIKAPATANLGTQVSPNATP